MGAIPVGSELLRLWIGGGRAFRPVLEMRRDYEKEVERQGELILGRAVEAA